MSLTYYFRIVVGGSGRKRSTEGTPLASNARHFRVLEECSGLRVLRVLWGTWDTCDTCRVLGLRAGGALGTGSESYVVRRAQILTQILALGRATRLDSCMLHDEARPHEAAV